MNTMKKLILFVVGLFGLHAGAQQPSFAPLSHLFDAGISQPLSSISADMLQARPTDVYTALDSMDYFIYGQLVYKERFGYDEAGNKNFHEFLNYNGSNIMSGERELWYYDTLNLMTRKEEFIYNPSADVWYLQYSIDYFYDANERTDSILVTDHTSSATPQPIEAYKYHYNAANLPEFVYVYVHDSVNWVLSERELFYYDAQDRLTSLVWQFLDEGTWQNKDKYEYIYDANDNFTDIYTYHWEDGTWVGEEWHQARYDDRGLLDTISEYEYNEGNWELYKRTSYEYDSYLNWSVYYVDDYQYGVPMRFRYRLIYDNSISYDQLLPMNFMGKGYFYDDSQLFRHKLDTLYFDQAGTDSWDNLAVVSFYYSQRNLNVSTSPSLTLFLYPNPADKLFYISLQPGVLLREVSVWDMQGRKVRSWKGYQRSFYVEDLPPGLYHVIIHSNRGISMRKLIIN